MIDKLNHPKLSALDIAYELEDCLDFNKPLSNSYLEDAITHIRNLVNMIKEMKEKDGL